MLQAFAAVIVVVVVALVKVVVKGVFIAFPGNTSQSYGASPAIWSHTLLSATQNRYNRYNATTAAKQANWSMLDLPAPNFPKGWKPIGGLGGSYIQRWFACPLTSRK